MFISYSTCGKNLDMLKRLGFTHVVNTAMGPDDFWHCNMTAEFYKPANIQFLGIKVTDTMNCQICDYFEETSEFIDKALNSGGE